MTLSEYSRSVGKSYMTVYRWLRSGKLRRTIVYELVDSPPVVENITSGRKHNIKTVEKTQVAKSVGIPQIAEAPKPVTRTPVAPRKPIMTHELVVEPSGFDPEEILGEWEEKGFTQEQAMAAMSKYTQGEQFRLKKLWQEYMS